MWYKVTKEVPVRPADAPGQKDPWTPSESRKGESVTQTIMVVEDDANIRAVLKYRLEKENYAVQVAANGLEALGQVGSLRPELVILDLMMPEMNGIEFLTHLKGNPKTRGIPVIVLTALGHSPQYARARELGAIGLVVKPFSPRELVEMVREALDSGSVKKGGEGLPVDAYDLSIQGLGLNRG